MPGAARLRFPRPGLPATLDVLRVREFRLLYSGQTVSVLGDGMLSVALAFAVLDLTGSVTDLGLVLAAGRAPLLLTVLAGGVVADRLPRRSVMVGADLVRLGAQGASAGLLLAGNAHLWELLALQALSGTASGFFYPASTGLVPATVPEELLQPANALRGLSDSVGRICGPALGGVIVVAANPGWALAADAATFAVSAWSLSLLRLPAHIRPPAQHFLRDLADGWREFRARAWVWLPVVVAGGAGNFFSSFFGALGPGIAKSRLGGAEAWAAILAAQGVGGLAGGIAILHLRPRRPVAASCIGWAMLAFPTFLLALVAPVPVIAAGAFAAGIGLAGAQALWDTALQRHIPREALSRVSAYDWFGSLLFNPVGYAAAGPIAGAVGDRASLGLAAGWLLVGPLVLVTLPAIRAVRDE